MGRHVIRLGDPTTHGGQVVSASATRFINGKQVARKGDQVTCPIPGHDTVTIIEGDPLWTDDGKPIALEGHKCSCGCSLISTLSTLVRSDEGSGASIAGAVGTVASVLASSTGNRTDAQASEYDERPQLTAQLIEGVPYYVETTDGRTFSGRIGADGLLPRIDTDGEREYAVYWGDEALAKMEGSNA
ncbi:MAG: PAAR domain-containing protein [Propionivibrio sp.]